MVNYRFAVNDIRRVYRIARLCPMEISSRRESRLLSITWPPEIVALRLFLSWNFERNLWHLTIFPCDHVRRIGEFGRLCPPPGFVQFWSHRLMFLKLSQIRSSKEPALFTYSSPILNYVWTIVQNKFILSWEEELWGLSLWGKHFLVKNLSQYLKFLVPVPCVSIPIVLVISQCRMIFLCPGYAPPTHSSTFSDYYGRGHVPVFLESDKRHWYMTGIWKISVAVFFWMQYFQALMLSLVR